jgi:hypothetical protein
MVVTTNDWTIYAGNKVQITFATITDDSGSVLDLTGRIVKFAVARFVNGEPLKDSPLIDYSSATGSEVQIPNPTTGSPHVTVDIATADTADLADAGETTYYAELEVFESDGSDPVVVATGNLTIRRNVTNA